MLLISIILLLLVNAVSSRRDSTIFFNRVAILILLYSGILGYESLYSTSLDTGIGIYGSLFHTTRITYGFDLFIYIIGTYVIQLSAFFIDTLQTVISLYTDWSFALALALPPQIQPSHWGSFISCSGSLE